MNIILLGYRGCGKSSLGKALAKKTWKDFLDIDELVRDRFDGATVAEIWETHGEPAYRAAEVEVTKDVVTRPNCVIALGGGTPMLAEAREAVAAATAKRVYLHCRAAVLAERLAADPQTAAARPALTAESASGGDPAEIARVLEERDPVYPEVAVVVLDVTHIDLAGALAYIMRTYV